MHPLSKIACAALAVFTACGAQAVTYKFRAPSKGLVAPPAPPPPPRNYAKWDPANKGAGIALSNGNLSIAHGAGGWNIARTTLGKSSGKWYWEIRVDAIGNDKRMVIGAAPGSAGLDTTYSPGYWRASAATGAASVSRYRDSNDVVTNYGVSYDGGFTISVLLDMDNRTIRFFNECLDQGPTGEILPAATYYPFVSSPSATGTPARTTANFGETNFKCDVPSEYNAGLY